MPSTSSSTSCRRPTSSTPRGAGPVAPRPCCKPATTRPRPLSAPVHGPADGNSNHSPKSNGRVIVLLGNHEVKNLVGELRDVTPAVLATFADARVRVRPRACLSPDSEPLADGPSQGVSSGAEDVHKVPRGLDGRASAGLTRVPRSAAAPKDGLRRVAARARRAAGDRQRDALPSHRTRPARDPPDFSDSNDTQVRAGARARRPLLPNRRRRPSWPCPSSTLGRLLAVAAGEIRAVNAIAAAAKEHRPPPDCAASTSTSCTQARGDLSMESGGCSTRTGLYGSEAGGCAGGLAARGGRRQSSPDTDDLAALSSPHAVGNTASSRGWVARSSLIDTGVLAPGLRDVPRRWNLAKQLTAIYPDDGSR